MLRREILADHVARMEGKNSYKNVGYKPRKEEITWKR